MSKGSSKVRAADSQGGYIYIYSRFKKNIFFFVLFTSRVSRRISACRSFVYCNKSVHCDFSWRTSYPVPEIQYSRSNSKRKFPGWKFPPLPYHITQTVAATGFRAYERYANRQKSTRERARERERERESTGGSARGRRARQEKTYTTSRKTRGERAANYILNHSFTWMNKLTFSSFFLSFIHSFIHSTFALHRHPSHYLSVKPFFRLFSSVDPNDNDRLILRIGFAHQSYH